MLCYIILYYIILCHSIFDYTILLYKMIQLIGSKYLLGWLETGLARNTLNYLNLA